MFGVGRAGSAVIAGEPGIGKTRLASELARAAHQEGAAVLLGRCHEEVLISYQPFVEAFARYVAAVSPEVLRGQVGPHGGELARLVPELAGRLPDLAEPARVDAGDERFRLFEAAAALLANASRSWPVVLVLEDLHWADKPTALLLTHVVRAIQGHRVLVVGTYRETELGEPLVSVLADLHRERAVERLRLGSLNRGDVATMISGWLGRPPPTHFAHALHRETEGNPFFIEEVLRHLIDADAVEGTEWARLASFTELGIPDGVREAIERRLAALSPAARRVVTMAAAIGRTFSIEVLDALAEQPGERLLDALEEATERRIVEEEAGALGRYAFAHALIRETLYASLSGPRRVGLHRRIGAIVEQQHADDADPPLGELAYHFVAAAKPGAAAKAVDYSARAARRALAALAYEEAVGHFDRALESLELSNSPDQATRCELLLGLGEARGKASEFDDSRAAFQAAAQLARTADLGEHLARAALGLGRGWIEQGSADPAVVVLLEEALAALPEPGTALRARLLGRLAMELHFSREPERCQALARQAVALARELGDPSTLAFALNAHHWAQRAQDAVGELLAVADETIRYAEASAELELALQGHSWRLVDLLELGQADEVDDEIAACMTLADRARPALLSILGRRAAPHARTHAGPLRRRRAARQGSARGGRVGGQLERHHGVEGPARMVLEGHRMRRRPRRRGRALRARRGAHPAAVGRRGRGVERQPRSVHGRGRSRGPGARVPRPRRRLRRHRADAERRRAQRCGARRRGVRTARRRTPGAALLRAAPAARGPVHPRRPGRLLPGRGRALPRTPGGDDGPGGRRRPAPRGRAGDERARAGAALDRAQPARPRPSAVGPRTPGRRSPRRSTSCSVPSCWRATWG